MGTTIVAATRKGGAGKTTTCSTIVGAVARRGHSVAVIDADYNHSLANWIEKFQVPNVSVHRPVNGEGEIDDNQVYALTNTLREEHDLVVVDTPGAASRASVFAMALSDLVIVPMMLSDADVVEAIKTFELIDEVRRETKKLIQARGLLCAYTPRTAIAAHVEDQVKHRGLPMMKTKLQHLTAFKEMTHNGVVPSKWQAGLQVRWFLEELAELDALPFLDMSLFGSWWKKSA